jgi:hypothetical protein
LYHHHQKPDFRIYAKTVNFPLTVVECRTYAFLPNHCKFFLTTATAIFAETLSNIQWLMQLTPESPSFTSLVFGFSD